MPGTTQGGKDAAATNKRRYGNDFYSKIGAVGGAKSRGGGFAYMKANGQTDKIKSAGSKGGTKSRRGKNFYYKLREDGEIDD